MRSVLSPLEEGSSEYTQAQLPHFKHNSHVHQKIQTEVEIAKDSLFKANHSGIDNPEFETSPGFNPQLHGKTSELENQAKAYTHPVLFTPPVDQEEDDMADYEDVGEEEDIHDYKKGGYHPCKIGDTFKDGRYVVVRKLGWGYFSTVWLAKDTHNHDEFVAIKVVRSAQNYMETALDEVQLLKRIATADPSHPGRHFIVSLYDHFLHSGPNGEHICMVFEVLGENLLSLMKRYRYKGLPPKLMSYVNSII
ncbi:Protein kinase dsk1 [Lucilia cuprina]|nr:Protein kinase dsk1 [Lucilia cuprina]